MTIALVGEAWGEKEEEAGAPFVGTSGFILNSMLRQIGIRREECLVTNVFNLRPKPSDDVVNLCGGKHGAISLMPALTKGKYVRGEYAKEVERLYNEIRRFNPNVIVAFGATAAWALLHSSGIKAVRGAAAETHPTVSQKLGRPFKVLPTYHPAAVAREWTLRPIVLADLDKAKREAAYPDVQRPQREIWIRPTIEDLIEYEDRIMEARRLSIDIETKGDQITCIGFAPSSSSAIVIPFYSASQADGNYWPTLEEELIAWSYVRKWCAAKPAIFQNGLYDIHFLWRRYGIPVPLAEHDTMLLHHAYQPEMEKGLGFLATIYTDEGSWKGMRKVDTRKED